MILIVAQKMLRAQGLAVAVTSKHEFSRRHSWVAWVMGAHREIPRPAGEGSGASE